MYNIDDSITDEDLTQIPKQALKAELKLMALDLNTPYSTIHEDNEIENLRRQARVLNKLFFKLLSMAQEDSAYYVCKSNTAKQRRRLIECARAGLKSGILWEDLIFLLKSWPLFMEKAINTASRNRRKRKKRKNGKKKRGVKKKNAEQTIQIR